MNTGWETKLIKKITEDLSLVEESYNGGKHGFKIIDKMQGGGFAQVHITTRKHPMNPEKWAKSAIAASAKRTQAHAQKVRKLLYEVETKLSKLLDAQTQLEFEERQKKKSK